MEGYYGRERHEVFTADGWFRTGDVCTADAEGFLYFKGRRGDMIKTAGANVSPREVEPVLCEVIGCESAIVLGLPDAERGQVVAAVLIESFDGMDDDALRAALRDRLSAYKVPRRFLRLARDGRADALERQARHARPGRDVRRCLTPARASRSPRCSGSGPPTMRDARFLVTDDDHLTYGQLDAQTRRVASTLLARRSGQGHPGGAAHAQRDRLGGRSRSG